MFSNFKKTFSPESQAYWEKFFAELEELAIKKQWCTECMYSVPYMESIHGNPTVMLKCNYWGGLADKTCSKWKLRKDKPTPEAESPGEKEIKHEHL